MYMCIGVPPTVFSGPITKRVKGLLEYEGIHSARDMVRKAVFCSCFLHGNALLFLILKRIVFLGIIITHRIFGLILKAIERAGRHCGLAGLVHVRTCLQILINFVM